MKFINRNSATKVVALSAALVLGSCQDLLDLQPQNSFSESTAFSTPDLVALSVAGMYDAAQSGFYLGGAVRGYPFGAAHVEQGDNRGEDVVNTQLFYAVTYEGTYDPTTANNDYQWQTLYALINRCNVVLAGLEGTSPSGTMTQQVIDEYKGEARFLRALAHHELLKNFARPYSDNPTAAKGGVPYRTTAITGSAAADAEAVKDRNTVAECYTALLADLDYAETVLSDRASSSASIRISRATKAAAIALKTRIYLHMGDWAKVVTEGNKIASQSSAPFSATGSGFGSYNLPANPYAAFGSAGSKSNTESIFSIENDAADNGSVNGALPAMYSTASSGGRGLVGISPLIWNQSWFLATDVRKSSTFVVQDAPGGGKAAYFTKKYTDITGRSDNAPVIRYAEVLLNMAEAIQRQSATVDARAFAMYNAVRSRSVTDPTTDNIADFLTANDLIQAILNERRIEFLAEGLRWGDIHRLAQDATFNTWGGGIPAKISRNIANYSTYYTGNPATNATIMATASLNHAAKPYSDFRFLWPIPFSETSLNPTLAGQQNPGY